MLAAATGTSPKASKYAVSVCTYSDPWRASCSMRRSMWPTSRCGRSLATSALRLDLGLLVGLKLEGNDCERAVGIQAQSGSQHVKRAAALDDVAELLTADVTFDVVTGAVADDVECRDLGRPPQGILRRR